MEFFLIPHSSLDDIWGGVFQIATGKEHTVNEVAELLKNELRNQCNIDMAIKYGEPRLGDVERNYSDTSKAQRILGWESEIDLVAGIKKTVHWFINKNA